MRPARVLARERGLGRSTRLTAIRLFRFSQSCQVRLNARSASATPICDSSASSATSRVARTQQPARVAQHADVVPHAVEQRFADRLEIAGRLRERRLVALDARADRRFVRRFARSGCALHPRCHRLAGDAAEDRRVRDAVAAETVRAVHAAGVLAGGEEPGQRRRAVGPEDDAAHHVVRGRHDLDEPAGEVEAAIRAALDHALELASHVVDAEVRHADVDAAVRRGAAGAHLGVDAARDDVARRPLAVRVVAPHEALAGCRSADGRRRRAALPRAPCRSSACPVPASRPVGWNCTISMSRSASPARSAIAMPSQLLSPDGVWYLYIVGPPPVPSSTAFASHEHEAAVAHVDHQHARDRAAVGASSPARRRDAPRAGRCRAPRPARRGG